MFRVGWIVLLALVISGCSTEPPKAYEIGHAIPLGQYMLAVQRSEMINLGNRGVLEVHFEVHSLAQPRDFGPFFKAYRRAFTLTDGNGKEYTGVALPEPRGRADWSSLADTLLKPPRSFDEMVERMGMDPERWEAVFRVAADTNHCKLRVENEMRLPGQAGAVVVDLRW
jgi:hypothetical protein